MIIFDFNINLNIFLNLSWKLPRAPPEVGSLGSLGGRPLGGPLGLFRKFQKIFEGLFGLFESKNNEQMMKNQCRKKHFLKIRKPHEKYQ